MRKKEIEFRKGSEHSGFFWWKKESLFSLSFFLIWRKFNKKNQWINMTWKEYFYMSLNISIFSNFRSARNPAIFKSKLIQKFREKERGKTLLKMRVFQHLKILNDILRSISHILNHISNNKKLLFSSTWILNLPNKHFFKGFEQIIQHKEWISFILLENIRKK